MLISMTGEQRELILALFDQLVFSVDREGARQRVQIRNTVEGDWIWDELQQATHSKTLETKRKTVEEIELSSEDSKVLADWLDAAMKNGVFNGRAIRKILPLVDEIEAKEKEKRG